MTLNQSTIKILALAAAVLSGAYLPNLLRAEGKNASTPKTPGEFYIISSVDVKENQIVLKRPTEVTELIQISDKTAFLDEDGKKIRFENLRAGDTVWVMASGKAQGIRVASQIRKGPMTAQELHRRYLKFD
ncbi:MAG: hypothetical protein HYS33_06020 [Acidobacteria bacterium]|nr:hypothetical protein [Acidobacteriota bacterium]